MHGSNEKSSCVAHSGDAVYLYSTKDEVKEPKEKTESSIIRPNKKARRSRSRSPSASGSSRVLGSSIADNIMEEDIEHFASEAEAMDEDDIYSEGRGDDGDDERDEGDEDEEEYESRYFPDVPVVMPRAKFKGACNVETVKDGECLCSCVAFVI